MSHRGINGREVVRRAGAAEAETASGSAASAWLQTRGHVRGDLPARMEPFQRAKAEA